MAEGVSEVVAGVVGAACAPGSRPSAMPCGAGKASNSLNVAVCVGQRIHEDIGRAGGDGVCDVRMRQRAWKL